jgi:CRP-like cAMP-binding protein
MSNRLPWHWLSKRWGSSTDTDPKARTLSQSDSFRGLSTAELRHAARQFDEVIVHAGTILTREGERNSTLWLIVEGHVVVTLRGRRVREHSSGDLIGLPTLLNGGVAGVTAVAYGLLTALVASERQLWILMSNPKIDMALWQTCAHRTRRDFVSLLWMTRENQSLPVNLV